MYLNFSNFRGQILAEGNKPWSKNEDNCRMGGGGLTKFSLDGGTPSPRQEKTLLLSSDLGRGHMNYNIQIIVVILKVTSRFFQQRPWIIGNIIMIDLGPHMPNMNYEVIVFVLIRWSWLNSKQWRHWIIGTFIMIVLQSMFSAKFTIIISWKNDYENFHRCFLILQ